MSNSRPRFLLGAVGVLLAVLAWLPWLDHSADGHYEAAFQRALITFGLARTLNGVVSVVQGTEFSVHPAGVGLTLAPGEVVDPINDLIERFSWLMLASTTSLGMQKILMDISAWWGISLILTLAVLLYLRFTAAGAPSPAWQAAAGRFLLLALFLRFAMPLMVVMNHAVYQVFMDEDYQQSTQMIEKTTEEIEGMTREETEPAEDEGLLDSISDWFSETADALDVRERMAEYSDKLAAATEHLLKLAAVFLMQTVVFPLLFLWLLLAGVRNLSGLLMPHRGNT